MKFNKLPASRLARYPALCRQRAGKFDSLSPNPTRSDAASRNKLIPELSVSNFKKSLEFYTKILGFKIEYQRRESKFAFLSFEGSQIMIQQVSNKWQTGKLKYPFGKGINFQIEVKNINPLLVSLKRSQYPIFIGPEDNWYRKDNRLLGSREFLVQDPDGYLLRFAQDLGSKSNEERIFSKL